MKRIILIGLMLCIAGCKSTSSAPKPPASMPSTAKAVMTIGEAMALIDSRDTWQNHPPINVPRHPAEKYLKGIYIVLDPGHGGKDHNGKGPAGILEADMNLRVGLLLGRLLGDAEAKVTLARSDDSFLELSDRAKIANQLPREDGKTGADLFVSLHHNSGGGRTTNWSSVWYHGQVDDAEPALDAAKMVALRLNSALRTDAQTTSPLFSDQLMYASGFGVLRACNVPCFLCESSFYSNPDEEQRLADAGYNLREAYAIYVGLCEWAQCGRPTQTVPTITPSGSQKQLTTTLSEGLPDWWGKDRTRIFASSICVKLNGKIIPHEFNATTKELTAAISTDKAVDRPVVEIHFANFLGNHNWPQRFEIQPGATDATQVTLKPLGPAPATMPATTRRTRE